MSNFFQKVGGVKGQRPLAGFSRVQPLNQSLWRCYVLKLLVIDGNSILNRAFYGIKILTTKKGEYTNAVYGFLTMMSKILDDTSPDAVAVAFDKKVPTFRHQHYDGYKATRHGMPDELAAQLLLVKEILQYLGYQTVECSGFEADDILGTLAREAENNNHQCIIATGDRDSLQLVSNNITVRLITTKNTVNYDETAIMNEYHVTPAQLIDIKAIQGDTSDNIPGVKGIGQKGANDLIVRFGSLDGVYQHIDDPDIKPAMRKKLIADKDNAYLSLFLGRIATNVPVEKDIRAYVPKTPDRKNAYALMSRLELFSLIKKFHISETADTDTPAVTFDFQGDIADPDRLLTAEATIFLLSADDRLFLCHDNTVCCCHYSDDVLVRLFESPCTKVTDNVKPFFAVLDRLNCSCKGKIADVELMAYLLNPSSSSYDIDRLFSEYTRLHITVNSDNPTVRKICQLSCVYPILETHIKENHQESLLYDMEIPLADVLASMENQGFMADRNGIENFGVELSAKLEAIEKEIYACVGYEFNINSPKQLGVALFEKLALPTGKKNKSGYSTNADVLEKLKDKHPVIGLIMEYRQLAKLKSTYCDGLLKVIDDNGRIHSRFNQTETRTGRISSTEPNLQNIPVRTELGREMRKFFIAKDGYVLVDADYSQIELRVLAHLADDSAMCEAFNNHEDIHSITASQVFGNGMLPQFVTSEMRSRAKAVNFGIVYGISAFSLAEDINVTVKQADKYIKDYLAHYSGIDKYMKDTIRCAAENGYAQTLFGRRRYLPELNADNRNVRMFGERVARNMPVQGTSADIIKIAMIKVFRRLKAEKLRAKLILQVHDELIVESPENEKEQVMTILKEEMENAVKLRVPLTVDAHYGRTWYDAKG